MKAVGILCFLAAFLFNIGNVRAWDQEQLEIFDLVEEINANFYTVLKVNQVGFDLFAMILYQQTYSFLWWREHFLLKVQALCWKLQFVFKNEKLAWFLLEFFIFCLKSATAPEIRSAFRRLSVVTHPDKNKAEDATEQFRRLVSVYEVLKDDSKRAKWVPPFRLLEPMLLCF